ncbi:0ac47ab5-00d6-48f0-b3a0-fbc7dabbf3e4 [Sclerotinia trifoliorum]|uniref:DNA (cytosine-5-)-methyltransferase n=1 Tax=Sclerotinia trifoliorum TaxID=28548 RepID=A0A8H2VLZ9_9HELO|nr:0ac47ab5-00d6-48f0-b3a0-fbc7dabbf3e4 [Sclerotinia trifoliorum]
MGSPDKAILIDDAVDVEFGIGSVSSSYASKMRPSSPALSEASSCTLREDGPDPVIASNPVVEDSITLNARSNSASFSELPITIPTPTKKRLREDVELSWSTREIFNTAKRHIGAPVAAFHNTYTNSRPLQIRTVPQAASLNQKIPLHSLRTHQLKPRFDSPPLPVQPNARPNTIRHVPLPMTLKRVINLDEEDFPTKFQVPPGSKVIDLEDYEIEAELEKEIFGIEPQILAQANFQRASLAERNPKIVLPNVEDESLPWKSSLLRPGKTVELSNGTFLKIKSIVRNVTNDEVSIRGWKLVRTRDSIFGGIAGKKRNELAFIHEIDGNDRRDALEQSAHTIRVDEVVKIRRLICTNKSFPECRYNKEDIPSEIRNKGEKEILQYVEDEMLLVARRAFVARYTDAEERLRKGPLVDRPRHSAILRSLKKEECTEGEFIDPDIKKKQWRSETVLGGSGNLNNVDNPSSSSSKYTYGDGYCGAGGMTVGAAAAGLKVKWGFDFNPHAGLTWENNFPLAKFHLLPVNEFAALPDPRNDLWVDILHLSPPCQVFSPAHTVPGRNDEMNYASLFGVRCAIEKARPRIVTLEQTFGILHPQNKDAFNGLITCFTDLEFDVSWQVVKFQGYGLPSRRTRLIILASCPGEALPHMPKYTYHPPHLRSATKKPYKTPNQVLSTILPNVPNHEPHSPQLNRANYVPWDGSLICGCILTSGGIGLGLPDGSRGMTNRELAALQGFPSKHVFYGQEIRKQVGNAVPPVFGRILLGSVRRQLERRDGWVRGEGIVISDDGE